MSGVDAIILLTKYFAHIFFILFSKQLVFKHFQQENFQTFTNTFKGCMKVQVINYTQATLIYDMSSRTCRYNDIKF